MSPRGSRILTRALAGVCALALVIGLLSVYVEQTVFDSRAFADRAVSMLNDEAVQSEVANALTDAAVDSVPNAVAARPLIQSVSEGLVRSAALQNLLSQGVEDVHAAVVNGDQDTLTVTLQNVGTLIRSGVATASPKLAEEISRELNVDLLGEDEGPPLGLVVETAQLQHNLDLTQGIAFGIALLAAIATVLLASTRLIGLRRLGRAIAGGGLVAIVVWFIGRTLLIRQLDGAAANAARAGYDAFVGDLLTWMLVLAGTGLVVAAGASSTREPIDVGAVAARAWGRISATPTSAPRRVLRAVVLVIAGIWILSNRELVLDLLAVAIGSFVVYIGAAELMRLAAGAVRTDAETEAARAEADLSGGAILRIGLVGAVLIGGFVGLGFVTKKEPRPPITVDTCNGYVELCDKPLDEVVFAGTHNSMSAATYDDWFFAQQEEGITEQLNDGIRALLIDPHYGIQTPEGVATDLEADLGSREKIEAGLGPEGVQAAEALRRQIGFDGTGKRELFLCHAFCEIGSIPLAQGLKEVRSFLISHPGEVLIISIEDATSPEETTAAIEKAGLLPYIYQGENGPPWPTLGEMIDSGQRLLVMAEKQGGEPPWYRRQFSITQETPYRFEKPEQLEQRSSCRPNRGRSDASFFLLNHWIDTSPAPRPTNAKIVNQRKFLLDRIARCTRIRGIQPNILAVDFYKEGDVLGVTNKLNGVGK